jgi:hypothetical protein
MEQAAAPAVVPTPPAAAVEDDEDDFPNASQQEDGPTMAVPSPVLGGPLRDDLLNPRPSRSEIEESRQPSPLGELDKYSETVSAAGDDARLPASQQERAAPPVLGDDSDYQEEPTRTVARDELMRHQDAAFVVADGAMGDEATLAVAPGQIDLGPAAAGIAAALQETLGPREPSHPDQAPPYSPFDAPPHFPAPTNPTGPQGHAPMAQAQGPYGGGPPMSAPPHQQAPWQDNPLAYGGPASQGMPSSQGGMPSSQGGMPSSQGGMPSSQGMPPQHGMPQQGMPPHGMPQQGMWPQGMSPHGMPFEQGMPSQQQGMQGMQAHQMGSYPASGHQPIPPSYQGQPSMGPMGAPAEWGQYPNQGGMVAPPQQAPWMQPQPTQQGGGASRLTPQILLLIVVGGVCLAIFVTGIVLFLTTKF